MRLTAKGRAAIGFLLTRPEARFRARGIEVVPGLFQDDLEPLAEVVNGLLETGPLRAELREVQFALDQEVKRLQFKIKALNIWAVPALIAVVAIVLALLRRRRAHVYRAAGEG